MHGLKQTARQSEHYVQISKTYRPPQCYTDQRTSTSTLVPKDLWEKLLLIVVLLITGAYINLTVGNLGTPRVGKCFPTAHA